MAHTGPKDFDAFLADLKKRAAGDGGVASNQIRQREAIISLDIPGEFGVTFAESTKKVHAKMLVIVSLQDHLVNPMPAREFAEAIAAPIVTLDSPCGHISLDCISAGPTVAKFLADRHGLGAMSRAHREIIHLARLLRRLANGLSAADIDRYLIRDAQHIIESIEALVRIHNAQEEDIYEHAIGA